MNYIELLTTKLIDIFTECSINVTSDLVYDLLTKIFSGKDNIDQSDFENKLTSFLKIHGATITASTVINSLAKEGTISISNSIIFATNGIKTGSTNDATFKIGNNTETTTQNNSVKYNGRSHATGRNALIDQRPDGSIHILTGKDGYIQFNA